MSGPLQTVHPNPEDLARLFDLSIDMLCIAGTDGYFKRVNPAFQATLGYSAEELLAEPFLAFVHPDDRDRTVAAFEKLLAGQRVIDFDNRYRCKDGSYRWLSWRSTPAGGKVYAVARDVSESKATQELLRVSEERFRQFADHARDVFWIIDLEPDSLSFSFVNPAFETIFGIAAEDLYGDASLWTAAIHEADRERVAATFAAWRRTGAKAPFTVQYRVRQADGSLRHLEDRAFPIVGSDGRVRRLAGVVKDMTEQRALEERLLQAQKMEAVGRLAGGVAHEFNNFLTSILGNLEFVHAAVARNADRAAIIRDVERIDSVARKAAGLTRQLLTMSSRRVVQPTVFDLNRLMLDCELVLARLVPESIDLVAVVPDRPSYVLAGAPQIQQVVMNLVVNAKDAMPGGGRLTLRVDSVDVDASMVDLAPELSPGAYVRITVADTGCGMSEDVVKRIFEPFFTTKPPGAGTGLGMAIVHGIVRQAKGAITIDSRVGAGTTVRIYLPSAQPALTPAGEAAARPAAAGHETILVCEDDPEVRNLVCSVLEASGYRVHAAGDPVAALQLARDVGRIDLLLTDVIMPRMSGPRLAERLRASHARTRVMYMSGYAADELGNHGLGARIELLEKPFSSATLLHHVRSALDNPEPQAEAATR